jgi:hypothetical protein
MAQPKLMAMISLLIVLSPGCSSFPATKEHTGRTVNPEITTIPEAHQNSAIKPVQARLDAQFDKCWQATLEVLQASGYTIQQAIPADGVIHTTDHDFHGPNYPWRESYTIQLTTIRESNTRIHVKRQVKVYWRLLAVGPKTWMSKSSNGKREALLIEKINKQLGTTGVQPSEN